MTTTTERLSTVTPPPLHPGAYPKMLPMPNAVHSPAVRIIEVHPDIDPTTHATTGWQVLIIDNHDEEIDDLTRDEWDDWNTIAARLVTEPRLTSVTNASPFHRRPQITYHGHTLTPFAQACRHEDFLFPSVRPVKPLEDLYDSSYAPTSNTPAIATVKNHLATALNTALADGDATDTEQIAALAGTEIDLLVQAGVLVPKNIRIRPVVID